MMYQNRIFPAISSALTVAFLAGCGGEEFGLRSADIEGCTSGNWERTVPTNAFPLRQTEAYNRDGTFRQVRYIDANDGRYRVYIEGGEWYLYQDNIVRAISRTASSEATSIDAAKAAAEANLAVAVEQIPPVIHSGSTHCDPKHLKNNVLIKYGNSPDVFRNERYLGFEDNWPTRMPTRKESEQITLGSDGIAEILRTVEYLNNAPGQNSSSLTHAAYTHDTSFRDNYPVIELDSCAGQTGCTNPAYISGPQLLYVNWKTALSPGTQDGTTAVTENTQYYYR